MRVWSCADGKKGRIAAGARSVFIVLAAFMVLMAIPTLSPGAGNRLTETPGKGLKAAGISEKKLLLASAEEKLPVDPDIGDDFQNQTPWGQPPQEDTGVIGGGSQSQPQRQPTGYTGEDPDDDVAEVDGDDNDNNNDNNDDDDTDP